MILRGQHGRYGAGVGRESGLENDAHLHVLEFGDPLLQLHVEIHGSGNGRTAPDPAPYFASGFDRRFDQLRMSGQAETWRRPGCSTRKIDDVFAVESGFGRARAFENSEPLIGARCLPFSQLFAEVSEWIQVLPMSSRHRHPPAGRFLRPDEPAASSSNSVGVTS